MNHRDAIHPVRDVRGAAFEEQLDTGSQTLDLATFEIDLLRDLQLSGDKPFRDLADAPALSVVHIALAVVGTACRGAINYDRADQRVAVAPLDTLEMGQIKTVTVAVETLLAIAD